MVTAIIIVGVAWLVAARNRAPQSTPDATPKSATFAGMADPVDRIASYAKSPAFIGGSPVVAQVMGGKVAQINSATEVEPARELDIPPALRDSNNEFRKIELPKTKLPWG